MNTLKNIDFNILKFYENQTLQQTEFSSYIGDSKILLSKLDNLENIDYELLNQNTKNIVEPNIYNINSSLSKLVDFIEKNELNKGN